MDEMNNQPVIQGIQDNQKKIAHCFNSGRNSPQRKLNRLYHNPPPTIGEYIMLSELTSVMNAASVALAIAAFFWLKSVFAR